MTAFGAMPGDLVDLARQGDEHAFAALVDPHRRELQLYCYRMLGSLHDAEDAVQETLLAAWRGLASFEGRASVRTWLYRIATNQCLNALRTARRRPEPASLGVEAPEPTRPEEVPWLQPYPDALLDSVPSDAPGPDARLDATEAVSLAFVTALQHLPPRQRAVVVLRDVLGYRARDAAEMLGTSEESVTSALKRARSTLGRLRRDEANREGPPGPRSAAEASVLAALVRAFETADVDTLVSVLADDVWVRMPPMPFAYQGKEAAARFYQAVVFRDGRTFRTVETRANGQPALATYVRDEHAGVAHGIGLVVVTLAGDKIAALTRFEPGLMVAFGLPSLLPTPPT